MKRAGTILRGVLLCILVLLTGVYITIQLPVIQIQLSRQLSNYLSNELKTEVNIGRIQFNLFNKLSLRELTVKDRQGDTLAHIGELQLFTSDFFFLHDSISIDKIELSNTQIYLYRTDSIWRHQFLLDYFSSGTSTKKSKTPSRFKLHLKEAIAQNFVFHQTDEWNGQRIKGQLDKLELNANQLNLSDDKIDIKKLALTNPSIRLVSFSPKRKMAEEKAANAESPWQLDGKKISINSFQIINGFIKIDQNSLTRKSGFDPSHMEIANLQASLSNSLMSGDTLQSDLEIAAKEKSGFQLKKLKGVFLLSPKQLSIKKFLLETPYSRLQESIQLSFSKLSDLTQFSKKVTITSDFNNSIIGTQDLSFFIPAAAHWKSAVRAGGLLQGKLNDLAIQQLSIGIGSGTYVQGNLTIKGLPNLEQTSFELSVARSNINWEELHNLLSSQTKTDLSVGEALRYVRFNGKLLGSKSQLKLTGNWQTRLGAAETALQLELPQNAPLHYNGKLQLKQFKLGELIGVPALEEVSFLGAVQGSGWNDENSLATFNGELQSAKFKNVDYRNVKWNATLQHQTLSTTLSIQNDFLQTNDLHFSVNWQNQQPRYSLEGLLEKADLKALNWTKAPLLVRGQLAVDASGQNINDLNGSFRFINTTLLHGDDLLPLDSISLTASRTQQGKKIEISSNEFQGRLEGQFDWESLPQVFQQVLHTHYPSQVDRPTFSFAKSHFQFDFKTQYVEPFLQLVSPSLTGLNQAQLVGSFDGRTNSFFTSLQVPHAGFGQYEIDSLLIQTNSDGEKISVDATSKAAKINEAITLPPLHITINGRKDSTSFSLYSASEKRVEKINLNAFINTFHEGVGIKFTNSDFTINGKSWTLNDGGNLLLQKNNSAKGYLKLSEGEQEIVLQTTEKKQNEPEELQLKIRQVNLNDLSPYFLPDNRLEGLVSGDFVIKDPLGDLSISSKTIEAKLLRLDNDSIGEITSNFNYDRKSNTLRANGNTRNQKEFLGFEVGLFFNDSLLAKNRINLQARTYPIKILERFLGDLFSDISGYLTGDVSIIGDLNSPGVIGKGRLKDAGLRVNYTQCFYQIEDKDIELTTSRIELDGMVLKDTVTGNPIYLTGGIDHESFNNLFYDLDVSTRKPGTRGATENRPVQLLSTTATDNSLFYGDVKGTALLQLRGPESDMVMTLNVTASEKDSSHFTLPPGTSRESGIADFLVERKYGVEMAGEKKKGNGDNILYDVELNANPLVEVKVQLDELTGDEIKGNGAGTFKIRSGTIEPLTLRGRFDIAAGNYLFTFQSFFKKPFEIKKGGTNYIEWTGDPYDANIKFEAQYKAERVSFSPLASTLNLTSDASNARSDVYVVARLGDKLFKPTIDFYLDFPPNSIANSNPELGLLLKQLQQNTNELNRQVTYLIVFNSFAPNELGGALAATGVNVNTISGMLLSVVSDQINKLFNNLLKSDKYRINLNTSLYNRNLLSSNNTSLSIGSNVNFSIGRSFFNNRFTISTGLGMDAPLGQNQTSALQQSILLLPDVTMEWLVNPSGTVRVSFFYRTNADYLSATSTATTARARRTGGSLSYKREFDKLGDLFRRKKAKASNN